MAQQATRRQFIAYLGSGSVAGVFIWDLAGCTKDSPNCNDLSGVDDAQKAIRKGLKYAAVSNIAAKNCANCQLYTAPTSENQCGGCTLFKGPVSPKGYCNGWQAK